MTIPGGVGWGNAGSEESRAVLDAFFLGKAVAEAVADRLSTAFGEILSDVGRLQAEQQKSLRKFQVSEVTKLNSQDDPFLPLRVG